MICLLFMCTRCKNRASEGDSVPLGGMATCHFCGNEIVTAHIEPFVMKWFLDEVKDEYLGITRVKNGLHIMVEQGDDLLYTWLYSEDYDMLPDNIYFELEKEGMV